MAVGAGGTANSTTVNSGGSVRVSSDGTANSTTVNSRGSVYVCSGGTANSTTVNSGGSVWVSSGGTANSTTVNGGLVFVSSGGTASSTTVNIGGRVYVSSGGTASSTTVNSGGGVYVSSGGVIRGKNTIAGYLAAGGTVDATDATIDFALNERAGTDSDITIISGICNIIGAAYTITVKDDQVKGTYRLASGASGFSQTITIKNTSGSTLGNVSVGNSVIKDDVKYTLGNSGYLYLTIEIYDAVAPTITRVSLSQGKENYVFTATVSATDNITTAANLKYQIRYAATQSALSAATGISGSSFTLSDSDAGKTMYYQIGVTDEKGNTSWSEATAFTVRDVTSPVITSVTLAQESAGYTFTATVTASDNGTATENLTYQVKYSDTQDGLSSSSSKQGRSFTLSASDAGKTMYYQVGVTDEAGNTAWSNAASFTVKDVTKPSITNIVADKTTPTNGSVTVTAAFADDVALASRQYRIDDGSWQMYTTGVVMTANGTITFQAADTAGNTATAMYTVSNIDRTAPTIKATADVTAATNGNVTVTAALADDVALASRQYRIDDGSWQTYTTGVVMTANGMVTFQATDTAGNTATASYTVSNIDKTAPTITDVVADKTTPTNGNVTVTAVFSDNVALAAKQFKIGDGSWQAYSTGVVMTANGTVAFQATDTAGNTATASYTVSNIDKTAPTIKTSVDVTAPTNGNVTVTATFADDVALASQQFKIGDGSWQAYSTGVVMTANGTVVFQATDKAGNTATATYTVSNIDRVPPAKPTVSQSTTEPTEDSVFVYADFSADTVKRWYSLNNITWQEYVGFVEMVANGKVYFRGEDEAGNLSDIIPWSVKNITRILPEMPSLQVDVATPTNGSVHISATFVSTATKREYSLDGAVWNDYLKPVEVTENRTVYFRCMEADGDYSPVASYKVTNIDHECPVTPEVTIISQEPGRVIIRATFADDSVLNEYSHDQKNWKAYTGDIELDETSTLYFRSCDAASNYSMVLARTIAVDAATLEKPVVEANVTAPTNGNVLLSATFDAKSSVEQYSWDGKVWQNYTAPIECTANCNVYFRSMNATGQVISEVTTFTVANIDKTAPVVKGISADVTLPTNGEVVVTASFEDDVCLQAKQYKIGNGKWQDYAGGVVMSANGMVTFMATDTAGNTSAASYTVSNIDVVAPTITGIKADISGPTNGEVVVSAVFGDNVALASRQYKIDEGNWQTYDNGVVMSENGRITFMATDVAGNKTTATYDVANIDHVRPSAPVASIKSQNPGVVIVTASFASDSILNEYSYDQKTWKTYAGELEITETRTVYFRSKDAASNYSYVTAQNVVVEAATLARPTVTADVTKLTNGNVVLTATFDEAAAINEYSLDGEEWVAYAKAVEVQSNGKVYFRSQSASGQVVSEGGILRRREHRQGRAGHLQLLHGAGGGNVRLQVECDGQRQPHLQRQAEIHAQLQEE